MMRKLLYSRVNRLLGKFGVKLVKTRKVPIPTYDMDEEFSDLYEKCSSHSLTSPERLFSLYKSVEYVIKSDIPGDFVECGVWRGGSCMMMGLACMHFSGKPRHLRLFDTFEGMSAPTEKDRFAINGEQAAVRLNNHAKAEDPSNLWAYAPLERVKANLGSTGYAPNFTHYVKGKVEETLPSNAPEQIAILRLDTDWYESTLHELTHLFPRLVSGGVLIIDDYGYFRGSREATDEYFRTQGIHPLLNRIDETARLIVKR